MQNLENSPYCALENAIGYVFRDRQLLQEALTHRSLANEVGGRRADNQRLEFLGDSILGFIVGYELFRRYPQSKEGELSRRRSSLVDEDNLARIASALDLGSFIGLGRGEESSGGRNKKSILADAYEALIAAVYLDGGINAVTSLVRQQFGSLLDDLGTPAARDYKTELQEITQARHGVVPRYELVESSGPDHERSYRVRVLVEGALAGEGVGRSKKGAQQEAAREALEKIG